MNDNVFENGTDFIYGRVIEDESSEPVIKIEGLEKVFIPDSRSFNILHKKLTLLISYAKY